MEFYTQELSVLNPQPIDPPTVQEQEAQFIANNRYLKNEPMISYVGIPGLNHRGPDIQERLRLAFASGLPTEVKWALSTCLQLSNSTPYAVMLRSNPWLLEELLKHLNCSVFSESKGEPLNDDIGLSLDAAIVLRNMSQDTENASILSMSFTLREILVNILNNKCLINEPVITDLFEVSKEILRYAVDIVESISSYLAPAQKDDYMFLSLMKILITTKDRSLIVSILRSLSRLMVRSNLSQPYAADNISQLLLDQVSSYMLLPASAGNDELILASVDFLYQYCLPGDIRVPNLLKSFKRSMVLKAVLPRLLTHGLEFSTEFSNGVQALKLVKRLKPPVPTSPPPLTDSLLAEIDALKEPDRATAWMRCCYQAASESEVTQISLWRSYEAQFHEDAKRRLPAVDFIKNVSNAFPNSSAMVINLDDGGRKFIIKGIQPRHWSVNVSMGRFEALSRQPLITSVSEDGKVTGSAMQEAINVYNYAQNSTVALREINTSSCLLLNCLVGTKLGHELFRGTLDDLLGKVMQVPALVPHIYDTLNALDY
ncbi:unnamed protein product [Kuraishia capsulata CBS 1993]|uniref:RFX-type winged-helix domain-containing protein n=1 Tax=Kuraishia capsulata CBS 1993 TaxID=1382522 RepID=W6MU16_9ASCO|nr:uncharacterized protein KUCA_T00006003001 [Kuraishia capsulata CBS 1993]CDK30008.1 unnamed protein product [Kuraishia capsulata CBS 1993]